LPEIDIVATNGVLRLGTASTSEPFTFRDSEDNITGFDIELAMRIAEYLQMELQIIDVHFGYLIPLLIAGEFDLIAGAISITEDRQKLVQFSESYHTGGTAILVRTRFFERRR
jgi:polar amino acid transport system substrate-binding protein